MDWRLLQLCDSAFPTGGFAHSGGLEAVLAQGEMPAGGLAQWARQAAWQAGFGALPFAGAAFDAPGELERLDALCDSFLSNPVANRASRAQGRSLAMACAEAFGQERPRQWAESDLPLHQAPVFGAAAALLGVEREKSLRAFLYIGLRGTLSAAVRLGLAGPLEAQRLLADSSSTLDDVYERCRSVPAEEAAQTAPLAELFQSNHDRLYSRLFQS